MTKLYLIRHGETDWNAERRLQGQIDIPLNEAGKEQAHIVASEFEDHDLHAIYSSPLQRAHATAQIINHFHQHEIQIEKALMEATYGSLEGMKIDEFHQKALDAFNGLHYRERLHFKLDPTAESYFEVYERAKPCLDIIAQNHTGQNILIVTHGGLMRSIIAMLADIDVRTIHISNAGWVALQEKESMLSIKEYRRITIG